MSIFPALKVVDVSSNAWRRSLLERLENKFLREILTQTFVNGTVWMIARQLWHKWLKGPKENTSAFVCGNVAIIPFKFTGPSVIVGKKNTAIMQTGSINRWTTRAFFEGGVQRESLVITKYVSDIIATSWSLAVINPPRAVQHYNNKQDYLSTINSMSPFLS